MKPRQPVSPNPVADGCQQYVLLIGLSRWLPAKDGANSDRILVVLGDECPTVVPYLFYPNPYEEVFFVPSPRWNDVC